MQSILSATSRGQITLPKAWRDQFATRFYQAEITNGKITLVPLLPKSSLESQIEEAWAEYKEGKVISQKELIKKYDL